MNRIALTGKLRSGKSTVGSHLELNYGFISLSFGDSLKRYADDIFDYLAEDITRPCPFGGDYVVGKRKPRRLYQQFGTLMREIDPEVWIKRTERSMHVWENQRDVNGIVIDDLRQPNEYDWARGNGFIIIRVNADESLRIGRAEALGDEFSTADLAHDTERHVDSFDVDFEIYNNGNMDDLKAQIDEFMDEVSDTNKRAKP